MRKGDIWIQYFIFRDRRNLRERDSLNVEGALQDPRISTSPYTSHEYHSRFSRGQSATETLVEK